MLGSGLPLEEGTGLRRTVTPQDHFSKALPNCCAKGTFPGTKKKMERPVRELLKEEGGVAWDGVTWLTGSE